MSVEKDGVTQVPFPGLERVIHGNGAVAYVMGQVCGGVIGYPITPSTEISEIFEAYRADGGRNVWGKQPFFFEPEGEHSAQSGALGSALTGGMYISNASSSQGILYGLESHYVTAGKKIGGFVLQVAARVVSKHALNVMAGHDDVYALSSSGYTILFGSNPQEAADLAAISYRVSALSLIPVANAMDGFATSHMQSEARLPEPQLLKQYLGDPEGRIPAPTLAQEMLFGAKGRAHQLQQFLIRHKNALSQEGFTQLNAMVQERHEHYELHEHYEHDEHDTEGDFSSQEYISTLRFMPESLREPWKRQWRYAFAKGSRQRVPALVDIHNPGTTGPVQNQPDFQSGSVDHQSHFVSAVPAFVNQAMAEYGALTGRHYAPTKGWLLEDADYVMISMGSVSDDVEAVVDYRRRQGKRVGSLSIKLFVPFPEAEVVQALAGKRVVTVLERSDRPMLTGMVSQALFKGVQNRQQLRYVDIPALSETPLICTAVFGLGGHDLQPRHLMAAFRNMEHGQSVPLFYLGSQFFQEEPTAEMSALQEKLRAAYPETELMAMESEENPRLLPKEAIRIRFHSVGGYGTIATGKLLTDILAAVMGLHSKSAPKYGSEKSGSPTNFYLTLSPQPIKITNAELEEVEIVLSPDHKVFQHTNPLHGVVEQGIFMMQSHEEPLEVWKQLPATSRQLIRDKQIQFFIVDAFGIAKENAPTKTLQVRMMGIAFIGAMCGNVERIFAQTSKEQILARIQEQIQDKFGGKGDHVVVGNMAVIKQGMVATKRVNYTDQRYHETEQGCDDCDDCDDVSSLPLDVSLSASMVTRKPVSAYAGLFDSDYFEKTVFTPFKQDSIGETPVFPGAGLFIPIATAAWKDKGLFRLQVPEFKAELCTGCLECSISCPDVAIPSNVHDIHDLLRISIKQLDLPEQRQEVWSNLVMPLSKRLRESYQAWSATDFKPFHEMVKDAGLPLESGIAFDRAVILEDFNRLIQILATFPVAKTKAFFDAVGQDGVKEAGLFSVVIDPWKCTGCLECINVCGPGALVEQKESRERTLARQTTFQFLSKLPNTPARFYQSALQNDGDIKRFILNRHNYYALTGGHGACRGCGEVTALRLFITLNRAFHHSRYQPYITTLKEVLDALTAKLMSAPIPDNSSENSSDHTRRLRIEKARRVLEKSLYDYESGPTGYGPANAVFANATGCSSVYGSTLPFNPYTDPWVNSLFQDSAPLAKGMYEGLAAKFAETFKAMRIARLELQDHYDPGLHDEFFDRFTWCDFSREEHGLMPAVCTLGGDGANYDIGFGALSRVLSTTTPLKVIIVDSGVYSNTGGQASTASFVGQDSDLARFGTVFRGKADGRKQLSLIAAFHPKVLVVQTSVGFQNHFLQHCLKLLNHSRSPALLNIYTPCQSEQGIGDHAATQRARQAVECRLYPLFVHDPDAGDSLAQRFDLSGNPDRDQDWSKTTLSYVDAEGQAQLLEIPFTPADFVMNEGRFKKHFHPIKSQGELLPLHQYIERDRAQCQGLVPFVWSVAQDKSLQPVEVSPAMVQLTQNCLSFWRVLQSLSGLSVAQMEVEHQQEITAWRHRYEQSLQERENSMDAIARGMSELAAGARVSADGLGDAFMDASVAPLTQTGNTTVTNSTVAESLPLVSIAEADRSKCNNCKRCYQEIAELFECTTILENGTAKPVSRVIPGALRLYEGTPERLSRLQRIANECDAEIIQFNRPA